LLSDKQRGVLLGMAAGLVATLAALALAITARPTLLTPTDDYAASVMHALRWDVLIVLCLTANIGLLARHRFFTPEDIDGGGLTKGTAQAQVLQATLQNTLEQTVLALSVHAVWAAEMPASWQAVIPAAAILFFIGRVLFWRWLRSRRTGPRAGVCVDVLSDCRNAAVNRRPSGRSTLPVRRTSVRSQSAM
jgi:hypothetical protein